MTLSKGALYSGLSIIAPTYDEAENVRELIERVEVSLKGLDFEVRRGLCGAN
jgi:hypothetical protein